MNKRSIANEYVNIEYVNLYQLNIDVNS